MTFYVINIDCLQCQILSIDSKIRFKIKGPASFLRDPHLNHTVHMIVV